MALFASFHHDALVTLPVDVVDRVVVDPTFATRDLVRALAARPRLRVVVVSDTVVRLLEGEPGGLVEIGLRIPALAASSGRDAPRRVVAGVERSVTPAAGGARAGSGRPPRRSGPGTRPTRSRWWWPGVTRQVAAWTSVLGDADAVVGTIAGNHDTTPVGRLDVLVDAGDRRSPTCASAGPRSQRLAATAPDRRAFGIDAVWAAAGAGRIELLCVEEGFIYPARPDHARNRLQPDDDLDRPEVLDDAIDEIIEMVRLGAGRVVTVHDGALDGCGRVAARLRW